MPSDNTTMSAHLRQCLGLALAGPPLSEGAFTPPLSISDSEQQTLHHYWAQHMKRTSREVDSLLKPRIRWLTNYKQFWMALLNKGKDSTEVHPLTSQRLLLTSMSVTSVLWNELAQPGYGWVQPGSNSPCSHGTMVGFQHPLQRLREMAARPLLPAGLPSTGLYLL